MVGAAPSSQPTWVPEALLLFTGAGGGSLGKEQHLREPSSDPRGQPLTLRFPSWLHSPRVPPDPAPSRQRASVPRWPAGKVRHREPGGCRVDGPSPRAGHELHSGEVRPGGHSRCEARAVHPRGPWPLSPVSQAPVRPTQVSPTYVPSALWRSHSPLRPLVLRT